MNDKYDRDIYTIKEESQSHRTDTDEVKNPNNDLNRSIENIENPNSKFEKHKPREHDVHDHDDYIRTSMDNSYNNVTTNKKIENNEIEKYENLNNDNNNLNTTFKDNNMLNTTMTNMKYNFHPGHFDFGKKGFWNEGWSCCGRNWDAEGCKKSKVDPYSNIKLAICFNHGEINPITNKPDSICGRVFPKNDEDHDCV